MKLKINISIIEHENEFMGDILFQDGNSTFANSEDLGELLNTIKERVLENRRADSNIGEVNFSKLKIGIDGAQKVITGYMHTLHRNILDSQLDNLKQVGAIDQIKSEVATCSERSEASAYDLWLACHEKLKNMVTSRVIGSVIEEDSFTWKDDL